MMFAAGVAPHPASPTGATAEGLSAELLEVARRVRAPEGAAPGWPSDLGALRDLRLDLDLSFCRDLADRFDRAPLSEDDATLADRYARAIAETRIQYDGVLAAGIRVRPWRGEGPPYETGRALCDAVRRTRRLSLLLTETAHGPSRPTGRHPLREPSGLSAGGVPLCHNDQFRVTHDVFGHVLGETGFGPAGELLAVYRHMALHSAAARPVLLTEQVAQVCWFYFGRHVRDEPADPSEPGQDGYVRPRDRPYPPQKVFSIESEYLDRFTAMFAPSARAKDARRD